MPPPRPTKQSSTTTATVVAVAAGATRATGAATAAASGVAGVGAATQRGASQTAHRLTQGQGQGLAPGQGIVRRGKRKGTGR